MEILRIEETPNPAALKFVMDAAFMGVSDVYLASFAPYPGSELFDQMYKNGQIPKLDDEYFLNLTSYTDLLHSYSYSRHVGHHMLSFYRIGGMSMFYILNFVLRPNRIFRLFKNVMKSIFILYEGFRASGNSLAEIIVPIRISKFLNNE